MLYNFQRLKDYALWYYFRYYPSNKRLLQKLLEKGNREDAKKVFSEIKHLLQENEIISSKIDNYVFRNKNYRYIRQKMFEKGFPKESVEDYLEKYTEKGSSLLDESFLRKKIENFIEKGKSKRYIYSQLGETREDKDILEVLLGEYFLNGEQENIQKEYQKLILKYPPEKVIQKLLIKGFNYNDIKNTLHNFLQ